MYNKNFTSILFIRALSNLPFQQYVVGFILKIDKEGGGQIFATCGPDLPRKVWEFRPSESDSGAFLYWKQMLLNVQGQVRFWQLPPQKILINETLTVLQTSNPLACRKTSLWKVVSVDVAIENDASPYKHLFLEQQLLSIVEC